MELDWTTFILEIINFLILAWLLKHFFYGPVLNIIAKRRESIQARLDEAGTVRKEAEDLKSRYESRLEDWKKEKAGAVLEMHKEIETERKQAREELAKSLDQERDKARLIMQRRAEDELRKNEKAALQQGVAFSSRLLTRLASPALEAALVKLALEDLDKLPDEKVELIKNATGRGEAAVTISSAYALDDQARRDMEKKLSDIMGGNIRFSYRQDPALIAGVRIGIGSWNLDANLQGELKYFADMEQGDE